MVHCIIAISVDDVYIGMLLFTYLWMMQFHAHVWKAPIREDDSRESSLDASGNAYMISL